MSNAPVEIARDWACLHWLLAHNFIIQPRNLRLTVPSDAFILRCREKIATVIEQVPRSSGVMGMRCRILYSLPCALRIDNPIAIKMTMTASSIMPMKTSEGHVEQDDLFRRSHVHGA